ncbi:hypothetical protein FA95DRAFT_1578430 [Auriscalpium vulgare]|uniref:Uncharacterized protein n=1 Tax=Auriscalpium vulgare TaxID=40419 RepID=A0ACB8R1R7_9AGAM|nr:hypothetical protein FA95DRAFT_1578430 [Auriscalpium vulgare]
MHRPHHLSALHSALLILALSSTRLGDRLLPTFVIKRTGTAIGGPYLAPFLTEVTAYILTKLIYSSRMHFVPRSLAVNSMNRAGSAAMIAVGGTAAEDEERAPGLDAYVEDGG